MVFEISIFKILKFNCDFIEDIKRNIKKKVLNLYFMVDIDPGQPLYNLSISGDTVVLRKTELGFMDEEDSEDRLRISLNSYIAHGSFKYKSARLLQRGSSFTQQDINDGFIRYAEKF